MDKVVKYCFDRLLALIGLMVVWPILLVIAILAKIKMPDGPVLFVQERVGKDGKLFRCHKFRTMTTEHNGNSISVAGESRIILTLRPGITGPATLKYRNEEELLATKADPVKYNDEVIYPDKVRINRYYAEHYSFAKDIQMIICTLFGTHITYNNEII